MNTFVQFIGEINFSKDTSPNTLIMLATMIPIITSSYFILNFCLNEDIEKKIVNIVGYSRKSLNFYCIFCILAYCMFPFFIFIFSFNKLEVLFISGIVCIMYFLGYIFFYLFESSIQKDKYFMYFLVIPLILSSFEIFIGSLILVFFDFSNLKIILWILYVCFVILYIRINLNKFKDVYGVKISFKNDEFNKYEQYKLGFILFETHDDIIFEINGILNRYRKSDIFCIEEVKDSYKSNLDKIEKGINKFKNNKNIKKLIKNEIYFIEKEFLKLQKISYLYNINRNKYMEYINSINTLIHLLNLIKKNVKIESYIKNDEIIKNDYENIKSELFKLKTFINN